MTIFSLWVNFNSPLVWDVFAISTYLSVSLVFWYLGLIPDLATIRDRAQTKASKFWYGLFSMGWTGSAKTWARYEYVSLILAGISTPLVLSVHTIVSMDFATSVIPGWHTTNRIDPQGLGTYVLESKQGECVNYDTLKVSQNAEIGRAHV